MQRTKILSVLFACLMAIMIIFSPTCALAADDACSLAGYDDPLLCGTSGGDEEIEIMNRVSNVLNVVYLWIGILAVIFIVVGGVRYMTSAGDTNKVQNAKSTITYSVVGLVVTLAAFAITNLVIGALDGQDSAGGPVAVGGGDPLGDNRYKVRGISSINQTSLVAGQSGKIKARVVPDYAKNKKITFTSSDPSILSIDEKGNVKAHKSGEVTITVKSEDGPSKKIKVKVTKPIPVTDISLSTDKVELKKKGASATVTARPIPSNATDKTLFWKAVDTKLITVTQAGKIKALKDDGCTKVTVTARNKDVFAGNPSKMTLANYQLAATKKVQKTIDVTILGNKLDFSYPGKGIVKSRFSSPTMRIVENHLYDVNAQNFDSYIKSKGGFAAYAKSLGGVFGEYYGKTITGRTEYDFQKAAEYVLGWMYMYGWDYMSGVNGAATGRHALWGNGSRYSDDAFYYKGGFRTKFKGKFDDVISGKHGVGMMASECGDLELFIYEKLGMTNRKQLPKVTRLEDLKVGDGIYFFDHRVDKTSESGWGIGTHNVIVGEVTDTEITFYDAGSHYQTTRNYKRKVKIPKPYSEEKEYENIYKEFHYPGWGMRRWYNFKKNS